MSLLNVFRRKWFRRLILVFMGLTMGALYHYRLLTDIYFEPFLLSWIVGFFSLRFFEAFINCIIVLIGMVAAVLVMALASQMGAQSSASLSFYMEILAQAFIYSTVPLLVWAVGLPTGFYLRKLVLEASKKKSVKES